MRVRLETSIRKVFYDFVFRRFKKNINIEIAKIPEQTRVATKKSSPKALWKNFDNTMLTYDNTAKKAKRIDTFFMKSFFKIF